MSTKKENQKIIGIIKWGFTVDQSNNKSQSNEQ